MRILAGLLLLASVINAADEAPKPEDLPQPPPAAGSYSGNYTWFDMPQGGYEHNTLTLTLAPVEGGFNATFTAGFRSDALPKFKEPTTLSYSGTLTGDPSKGGASGIVAAADGTQRWQLDVKITRDGRCVGFAREQQGYGTWGAFALAPEQAATPAAK